MMDWGNCFIYCYCCSRSYYCSCFCCCCCYCTYCSCCFSCCCCIFCCFCCCCYWLLNLLICPALLNYVHVLYVSVRIIFTTISQLYHHPPCTTPHHTTCKEYFCQTISLNHQRIYSLLKILVKSSWKLA